MPRTVFPFPALLLLGSSILSMSAAAAATITTTWDETLNYGLPLSTEPFHIEAILPDPSTFLDQDSDFCKKLRALIGELRGNQWNAVRQSLLVHRHPAEWTLQEMSHFSAYVRQWTRGVQYLQAAEASEFDGTTTEPLSFAWSSFRSPTAGPFFRSNCIQFETLMLWNTLALKYYHVALSSEAIEANKPLARSDNETTDQLYDILTEEERQEERRRRAFLSDPNAVLESIYETTPTTPTRGFTLSQFEQDLCDTLNPRAPAELVRLHCVRSGLDTQNAHALMAMAYKILWYVCRPMIRAWTTRSESVLPFEATLMGNEFLVLQCLTKLRLYEVCFELKRFAPMMCFASNHYLSRDALVFESQDTRQRLSELLFRNERLQQRVGRSRTVVGAAADNDMDLDSQTALSDPAARLEYERQLQAERQLSGQYGVFDGDSVKQDLFRLAEPRPPVDLCGPLNRPQKHPSNRSAASNPENERVYVEQQTADLLFEHFPHELENGGRYSGHERLLLLCLEVYELACRLAGIAEAFVSPRAKNVAAGSSISNPTINDAAKVHAGGDPNRTATSALYRRTFLASWLRRRQQQQPDESHPPLTVTSYREANNCCDTYDASFYRNLAFALHGFLVSMHLFRHDSTCNWKWIKLYYGSALLALRRHAPLLGLFRGSGGVDLARFRERRRLQAKRSNGAADPVERHRTASLLIELFKYLQLQLCGKIDLLLATKRQIRLSTDGDRTDEVAFGADEAVLDPWIFADVIKRRKGKQQHEKKEKEEATKWILTDSGSFNVARYDQLNVFDLLTEMERQSV